MSVQLSVGDTVLVYIHTNDDKTTNNERAENLRIGIIKYIGYIHGYSMTEYIGIELVEPINNGHNGTINDYQYFHCAQGYGIHTKITNVVRKLEAYEVAIKLQQIITIFKSRLNQYVEALSERDEYIERLKKKQKYLRQLLRESQALEKHLNIDYRESITNPMQTESPSFSSVNTLNSTSNGIVLFNPHSINITGPKDTRKSTTSQFQSFVLTPMTPMTLTPQSVSPSPPVSNISNVLHVPAPSNKAKPSQTKLLKKKEVVPWNLNNDTFPDTEPIECNKSTKQQTLIPIPIPTEYAKYTKDIVSPETEWTENNELCDEYEDDSSFHAENYDNNIYSPYSTVPTSKTSEYHQKKSPKISESKSYSPQHSKQYISTESASQQYQRPKMVDSKSHNIEYMTFPPQQQQYTYNKTNIARTQIQKHREYMKQIRVPIYTLYLQPPRVPPIPSVMSQQYTTSIPPLLIPSYSNQLHANIASKSTATTYCRNKSKPIVSSTKPVVVQQHNGWNHRNQPLQSLYKQPYYVQPQIDHWIQEKQREHAQSQK